MRRTYAYGAIRIRNGKYQDQILVLQRGEVLQVGRDTGSCNLVLEAPWVSKVHCSICYDAHFGQYMVTDHSTNGTYLQDGTRLKVDQETDIIPGSVIRIGEHGIGLQLL